MFGFEERFLRRRKVFREGLFEPLVISDAGDRDSRDLADAILGVGRAVGWHRLCALPVKSQQRRWQQFRKE